MKKIISSLIALPLLFLSLPLAQAGFSDITEYYQFYDAVNYVEAKGIVSGHPDGSFKPADPIDRAAFTKIIIESQYTSEEIEACNTSAFPDVALDIWYAPYVCVAQKNQVIAGYDD